MDRRHPYLAEVTRALMVLALILLNLAHQTTPSLAYDSPAYTAGVMINCGDVDHPDTAAHAPCHACRIGSAALLPPPPDDGEPAALVYARLVFMPDYPAPHSDSHAVAYHSRGPPLHA